MSGPMIWLTIGYVVLCCYTVYLSVRLNRCEFALVYFIDIFNKAVSMMDKIKKSNNTEKES